MSPTQLALRQLRRDGWPLVQVVEHWNPHARIRQDLFGVIDVLAIGPAGTLAIQATSTSHVANRVTKIREHESTPTIIAAGWGLRVWAFKKVANRWVLHRDVDMIAEMTS